MDNADLSSVISSLMSDKDLMSKLMQTVGNATDTKEAENKPEVVPAMNIPHSDEARNRQRLIDALKPYLSRERRESADKLLGLLSILELTQKSGIFKGR